MIKIETKQKILIINTKSAGDFRYGTMEGLRTLFLSNFEKLVGIFKNGRVHG